MALVINTNTASISAQRQIWRSGTELDKATERLSSGKRINSASDDAAGLAIGNRLTSQIRGLNQAVRNANDGVSLIQVAEGALNETTNMLQRVRELSVQASNGIYSAGDRATLNAEVKQLLAQVDLISKNTEFNGRTILDGKAKEVSLQVGADDNQTIEFKIPKMDTKSLGFGSLSGDLVGAQIGINNAGKISTAIPSDAIKINGRSIPAVEAGTTLKDFIAQINNNIDDVEASSAIVLKTDAVGSGVLKGAANLVISGVNLDGTTSSFTIKDTNSLADLAQKINSTTQNSVQATIDDTGKLVLNSTDFSTMTIVDSTGGTATGASPSANADKDISDIVSALKTSWISEAEGLISTYFGMTGDDVDITLNLIPVGDAQSDGAAGKIAWVAWNQSGNRGINLSLNLDMADFTPANLPNGNMVAGLLYSDRVVAHELVHAVMTRNVDMSGLPGWFKEGAAEFIQGADERLKTDIHNNLLPDQATFNAAFDAAAVANPAALGYSVGYLAVKMLHAEIKNAGGNGISDVFDQLQMGKTFDQALQQVSNDRGLNANWTSVSSFGTYFKAHGFSFMNGGFLAGTVNLQAYGVDELDTGSVAGSDFGGSAKTNASIIPDAANQGPQHFNLVVPSQYGGGSLTADAQLILTSKTGDAIRISKGTVGTDDILKKVGFVETTSNNVIGNKLDSTNQAIALASGDLEINGVNIGATLSTEGLNGKIAAINAKKDQTFVTAESLAKVSFSTSDKVQTEYIGNTVTKALVNDVIGINGLGVAITAGDSLTTVAANINAINSVTGAKAYVDDGGKLHIFSQSPLNLSQSVSFFTDIGIVSDVSSSGSINIKGVDVSLSNIYDKSVMVSDINKKQAQTGVFALVDENGKLTFQSASSFTLKLGATNGLKTLSAIGISSTLGSAGSDLSDTNSNHQLTDETVDVNARIHLTSTMGSAIQIKLTTNGENATGLLEQNQSVATGKGMSLNTLNVLSVESAESAIKIVDNALSTINSVRSNLGAINNRLDFTIANLSNISEKTTVALSRIVDTDFAQETAKLSRSTVLQQAAQAMLAQANSRPNQVLTLLR